MKTVELTDEEIVAISNLLTSDIYKDVELLKRAVGNDRCKYFRSIYLKNSILTKFGREKIQTKKIYDLLP